MLENRRIAWSTMQIPFQAEIKLGRSNLENFANTDKSLYSNWASHIILTHIIRTDRTFEPGCW